jgi:hypothetical protein
MNARDLKKLQEQRPFVPYEIRMVTGQVLHVPHPEFLYVPPGGGHLIVHTDAERLMVWVNTSLIATIHPAKNGTGRSKGRKAS